MRKISIETTFTSFENFEALPKAIQNLMSEAVNARKMAYAPYSSFQVGAALLLENGVIVKGSNQENAAYPSGLCAERTAIFAAGANFPNVKIKAICITGTSLLKETNDPIPPCGACRQSLLEYENRQKDYIPVYFMGQKGEVICSPSVKNLLPFIFKEDSI